MRCNTTALWHTLDNSETPLGVRKERDKEGEKENKTVCECRYGRVGLRFP